MDEENIHQVPRGLTFEQALFLGLQRGQEELSTRLDLVIQALDQMAVVPAPPQRTSSPEEYLEWVQRVDKVFECYEYSEAQKCQLAALEFTNYANLW
ncbi:hypothetical protein CRG98_036510 [Punica granatum]|uniref:Uncharacterized protein n=1 Tax=Punica granatum TaxID=22663 RepID=A0A2I0IGI5_PUNGR|nr:hypothetical protein CRG98_036510 [Punica granatum]